MNKEVKIDLGKIVKSYIHNWWIIVICGVVALALTCIATSNPGHDSYVANTTVYSMSYSSFEEAYSGNTAMNAYVNVVKSQKVAERAKSLLGEDCGLSANEIKEMITVNTSGSLSAAQSVVLTISAHASSPEYATSVANAVANAFVSEIRSMTGSTTVQVLDSAQSATMNYDATQQQMKKRTIGFVAGIIVPIVVIFFIEIFSKVTYRVEDIGLDGKIDIIGVIPDYDNY